MYGAHLRRRVDLDLLGADDGPPALGLDPAHVGVGGRVVVPHPVAVRHLEEAVARGHRPELHGLEEDVVAGIAHRRIFADPGVAMCTVQRPGGCGGRPQDAVAPDPPIE